MADLLKPMTDLEQIQETTNNEGPFDTQNDLMDESYIVDDKDDRDTIQDKYISSKNDQHAIGNIQILKPIIKNNDQVNSPSHKPTRLSFGNNLKTTS